jgi:hypothetical protein
MDNQRRYTEGNLFKLVKDFWPLILAIMGVAVAYGAVRADIAKVPDLEKRLTTVEQSQRDMKDDVLEIKTDVKRLLRRG